MGRDGSAPPLDVSFHGASCLSTHGRGRSSVLADSLPTDRAASDGVIDEAARLDQEPDEVLTGGGFSGEGWFDEVAVDVGEAEVAALGSVGEAGVFDAHEVEDGGVEVVDVDGVFGDVVAEVVGGAES